MSQADHGNNAVLREFEGYQSTIQREFDKKMVLALGRDCLITVNAETGEARPGRHYFAPSLTRLEKIKQADGGEVYRIVGGMVTANLARRLAREQDDKLFRGNEVMAAIEASEPAHLQAAFMRHVEPARSATEQLLQ
ncbi:MAG TPA: hypothetical protein VLG27_03330 [Candidatus Saccharimonadia bacterium]|nr:hypothetical protein [Candidatus Saccharimonadia bacterium]